MSDTTNDTSIIDEKKTEEIKRSATNLLSKIKSFITSLIGIIVVILLYFLGSGFILFACKLAQSNILPTELNCYPYTDNKPNIENIQTNIFTTSTEPQMSMKLEIPINKNDSNVILNMFRDYKNQPSSNFLANYFISIVESLMCFDYSMINNVMNYLNSLPEALLICLGPILVGIIFSIFIILNGIYFIYLWFSNMSWFFKTNTNKSGEGKPKWSNVSMIFTPVNNGIALAFVILFAGILFMWYPFISIVPFIILFYVALSCLLYKGLLNNRSISSFGIALNVLKYYKLPIAYLISLFLIYLAFSKLGIGPGIFSIITVSLIYFNIISIDIFKPISETNLTPLVDYTQAKKTCTKSFLSEETGFLYNLLFGQKGGDITKQLKKINNNLMGK